MARRTGGTLDYKKDSTTQLVVDSLLVCKGGTLRVGTVANPIDSAHTATIEFSETADDESYRGGLFAVGKVFNPQYALWIMPLIVMVDVPWRRILAYLASDAVLYVSGWYWYATAHPFTPPASLAEKTFVLAVFARSIALIAIATHAARRGRRRSPAAPDAEAVPVPKHFFAA